MSDLYSVIPALSPTSDEIVAAELLAKQILEAQFPDLDLREGTGLRDLVLRPTSYAFALLKKATDYYFANNTLAGVNDTTDTEIIDDLLSNWFMYRHTGTNAVIGARLYFATQKNVTLPASTYFSPDNSLRFFPSSTQTYSANAMSWDSYSNEWYIDVQLVGEAAGTAYNIGSGSLLYFGNFDPYFLHAEISYLSQSATDAETNTSFISRSQSAISTRNLINIPSVTSNLQAEFNTLTRIQTIGMGDADMIRDQIKAVIDPETPRIVSAITSVSTVATATLLNHGFQVGQIINVYSGFPTAYNGQFSVTSVPSVNQFTYNLLTSAGSIITLPLVQSYTAPCLVHTGGKVDLYVGDSVSSTIVQVSTDQNGRAVITGPVYDVDRSGITGGSLPDTLPFTSTVPVSAASFDIGLTGLQVTTSTPHNLVTNYVVSVTGVSQIKTITSLSCLNLVVTAVSAGHNLSSGMQVTVSGVTPISYNGTYSITVIDSNTFTYVVPGNILVVGSGTMIISNPAVDGNFPISSVGTTTFSILMNPIWIGATNSFTGVSITYTPAYTITNPSVTQSTLTSLTGVGTFATATLSNHGLAVNRYVTISGATPSAYNGTFKVTSALNANQFQYNAGAPLLSAATGSIYCSHTTQWLDYGFSENQVLNVDFGTGYANMTVSFQTSYFDHVLDVQTYVNTPTQHVLCGDYLARGFNLYVLDLNVIVYNLASPTTGLIQSTAQTYLSSLAQGATFMLSDLVAALNVAGVTNIQTPLGVNYTYYHRDLVAPKTGVILDYLDPVDQTNVFILGNVTTSSATV